MSSRVHLSCDLLTVTRQLDGPPRCASDSDGPSTPCGPWRIRPDGDESLCHSSFFRAPVAAAFFPLSHSLSLPLRHEEHLRNLAVNASSYYNPVLLFEQQRTRELNSCQKSADKSSFLLSAPQFPPHFSLSEPSRAVSCQLATPSRNFASSSGFLRPYWPWMHVSWS